MRKKGTKSVVVALLLFMWLFPKNASANDMDYTVEAVLPDNQVSQNTYFDLQMQPGQEQMLTLAVSNLSDHPIRVSVTPHDAYTNRNGLISYDQDKVKLSPHANLQLTDLISEKQEVRLAARESKQVAFRLKMPKESFSGYLLGAFRIQEEQEADISKEEDQLSVTNQFVYTVGVKLREKMEAIDPVVNLERVKPELVANKPQIVVTLVNDAPTIARNTKIHAEVYKGERMIYETTKDQLALAPYSYFDFGIGTDNQPLKAGKYLVKLTAYSHDKKWQFEKNFTIQKKEAEKINEEAVGIEVSSFHVWYVILGILCVLLLAGLVYLLKKNRELKRRQSKR